MTRCTEKLLSLVIENIFSTAKKSAQVSNGTSTSDLIQNLQANIRQRGVKQGLFHIHLDKDGKPEKISLKKDDTLTIISPPPRGEEQQFNHVLENVVPKVAMRNGLSAYVREYLNLQLFTEFECVSMIWESLYEMFYILQKEPMHHLVNPSKEGSTKASDYNWGYSEDQKNHYKLHAERLYQLMCLRYGWQNITPYMIKIRLWT